VILVSLFHDVGKIGTPTAKSCIPRYLPVRRGRNWQHYGVPYQYNSRTLAMPLAVNSLYILDKFIDLYPDESAAICSHDGQFIPENRSFAHNEVPLALLVHYADYFTGHVTEGSIDSLTHHRHKFGIGTDL
jgi:hypothetical protein